jgi:hypothetical protein
VAVTLKAARASVGNACATACTEIAGGSTATGLPLPPPPQAPGRPKTDRAAAAVTWCIVFRSSRPWHPMM